MTGKIHIERLYNECVDNPRWIRDMTSAANFANGLLQGRFLNEMLQNTDDARGSLIECSLNGRELTMVHDGRHFDKDDVEKIALFANQEIPGKSADPNMTGFKGIGFKALLAMATRVDIISNNYSFRFDKDYWGERKMPWELVPIWTDPPKMVTDKVTFVFELLDPDTIRKELEQFCTRPEAMLFLRNVRTIEFTLNGTKTVVKREDREGHRFLKRQDEVVSEWVIKKSRTTSIPYGVWSSLHLMNTTLCPERLKRAQNVELTFAYPQRVEPANVGIGSMPEVFCTLPTKVYFGLPFAVNCEFLLEAQRENLVSSIWNEFLIKMIGSQQFLFLQKFVEEARWKSILTFVGPVTISGVDTEFQEAYEKGFSDGCDIPWIPSQTDPHKLLKLNECYIDTTGFYTQFKDDLSSSFLKELDSRRRIREASFDSEEDSPKEVVYRPDYAHPDLEQKEKLEALLRKIAPSHVLDEAHVIGHLESCFRQKKDPNLWYRILTFIREKFTSESSVSNLKRSWRWVPRDDGYLGMLDSRLLPPPLPPGQNISDPPIFLKILMMMDKRILDHDRDGALRGWLQHLGMRDFSTDLIINGVKEAYRKITIRNSFSVVNHLFDLYSCGQITPIQLNSLGDMPVLTKDNKMKYANKLLLSQDLDSDFVDELYCFIHPSFMSNPADRPKRVEFFKALGVRDKRELLHLDKGTVEGFRSEMTVDECFRLLGAMQKKRIQDLDLYTTILKNLVERWKSEKSTVPLSDQMYFIASDNSWQPASSIKYLALSGIHPSSTSNHWFKNVSPEVEQIARKLNLPIVTKIVDDNQIPNKEIDTEMHSLIKKKLPLLAWVYGNHRMQAPVNALKKLAVLLSRLTIFKVGSIPCKESGFLPMNVLLEDNQIYYTEKSKKHRVFEKIAEYFGLRSQEKDDFIEVLSLKVGPSTGGKKTEEDWISERGISFRSFEQLGFQAVNILRDIDPINEVTFSPVIPPTAKKAKVVVNTDEDAQPQEQAITNHSSQNRVDSRTVSSANVRERIPAISVQETLDNSTVAPVGGGGDAASLSSPKPPAAKKAKVVIDLAEDEDAPPRDKTTTKTSHTSQNRVVSRTTSSAHEGEWSPDISVESMKVSKIAKRSLQPQNPVSTSTISGSKRKGNINDKLSNQSKSNIGRWGEEYALKQLIHHYEDKYHTPSQKKSPGLYVVLTEDKEISIEWVNWNGESQNPYDMVIKKKKGADLTTHHVEIKATMDSKVRFFMSGGEWSFMEKTPKYRLYVVLNAGTQDATLNKLPKDWRNDATIQVQKYEITANLKI